MVHAFLIYIYIVVETHEEGINLQKGKKKETIQKRTTN